MRANRDVVGRLSAEPLGGFPDAVESFPDERI
jgi:hypothetical protein